MAYGYCHLTSTSSEDKDQVELVDVGCYFRGLLSAAASWATRFHLPVLLPSVLCCLEPEPCGLGEFQRNMAQPLKTFIRISVGLYNLMQFYCIIFNTACPTYVNRDK